LNSCYEALIKSAFRLDHTYKGIAMNTRALNLVPMVVEQTARGERAYDI